MIGELMEFYFSPAPPEHQKREKAKARDLRKTQWWKNQIGRGVCHYCEQKFQPGVLTMDHLVPIIRGGKSDKRNCVPSCKGCNNEKGYKTLAEWSFEKNEKTRL
jgi:5-methylcytosine-specific restriction protein A